MLTKAAVAVAALVVVGAAASLRAPPSAAVVDPFGLDRPISTLRVSVAEDADPMAVAEMRAMTLPFTACNRSIKARLQALDRLGRAVLVAVAMVGEDRPSRLGRRRMPKTEPAEGQTAGARVGVRRDSRVPGVRLSPEASTRRHGAENRRNARHLWS
jgi:hypothetical protein